MYPIARETKKKIVPSDAAAGIARSDIFYCLKCVIKEEKALFRSDKHYVK
jgi:hypothetical protein